MNGHRFTSEKKKGDVLSGLNCSIMMLGTLSFIVSSYGTNFSGKKLPARCDSTSRHYHAFRRNNRRSMIPSAVMPSVGEMSLPEPLLEMVEAFAAVPDVKLRYQQLLFFAQQLPPMDPALKIDENLVRGCQSVVHISVTLDESGCVRIQADSDAQLTKGLVALLVRGFDGASPQEVLNADPAFLSASGLSSALTPARNNGFASALALVKFKVQELVDSSSSAKEEDDPNVGPTFKAIVQKLSALEPTQLNVIDESDQHAGHAAMRGMSGETHFAIKIVSDKFASMTLVNRHREIYKLLEEEMAPGRVHALTIEAKAPAEVIG